MKFTTNSTNLSTARPAMKGLETIETVSLSAPVRSNRNIVRALFSAALLTLLFTSAFAQDKPVEKKMDDKPAAAAAQPAAPAGPAPGAVTISGLLDGYYQTNFQHPKAPPTFAAPVFGVNATRAFDVKNNFGFSLGEINITRTAGKGFPLGVTGTFTVGDTPPVVNATDPGRRVGYEGIQQLYITYTPHILGREVAIDFGKFVTSHGNEVIESTSNDNYSRGLLFTYAIPFYHTGFRAVAPLSKQINLMLGLVNGWNNVRDDNEAKTIMGQLTWTSSPSLTTTFTFMGGSEGTGAYGTGIGTNGNGNITTNLFEIVPVWNATSKLKFALDGVYGTGAGDVNGVHTSGTWFGVAANARYQWTPQIATALRVEQFEDHPGTGGVGLRLGVGSALLHSYTATLEYATFHGKLISRLEFRHDTSNIPFGAIGRNQDTLTLGEAYKF